MQKRENKKLVVGGGPPVHREDLFDAARRAGIQAEFVKAEKELLEKAESKPALIILDLNFGGVQPLKLIGKLKSNPNLKQTSILAYVSHVDGELKQQAHDLGCDMVMARSAFSQNLPQIFSSVTPARRRLSLSFWTQWYSGRVLIVCLS